MQRSIDPRADAAALYRLLVILRRAPYDLVHLHSSKAGFLGRLAARASGRRPAVVYSPHGLAFLGAGSAAKNQLFLQLERMAGPLCDRIIAVSPSERDLIVSRGLAPAERVACIPNGVAAPNVPAASRAAVRARLGIPADAPLIGTAARLSPQKDPLLFVAAAAGVVQQHPSAQFVWCGGGELMRQAQAAAAARGIAHACHFIGHRDDAGAVVAALDLFWLTSRYEGLPLAPLEAMALGVPIIATDVPGTRDLLRSGAGLLVPAGAAGALAAASARLLAMPERRARLAEAGRRYFRQHGTASAMLDAVAGLYGTLVAQRALPAPHLAVELGV